MGEDDIKLFSHNEKAYRALVECLLKYPLSFIEHATGTGKSFIILKYLFTKMRHKRILFISLHDEMFDQLFGKQMHTLGMKKEDFLKFDTLIYHNLIKYDPKKIVEDYDCIVFDEAHHCGAKEWGKIVEGIKEEVLKHEDKKMIGLTATGIRYLDDYMDVCENFFDGHCASKLNVAEAILKLLLPAPLYINSIISCKDKYERVKKKLDKLPKTKEILDIQKILDEIGSDIKDNSSVADLLKKYGVHSGEKYIVFCKNIKDLKQKMQEAKTWFKDIGEIKMYQAHSAQKKDVNRGQIEDFEEKSDALSLMFAVDIFNEGFHIEDLDGILMFRKTMSPTVYLQQIGRALSFSARKKQIKIFDFVDNISGNDVIRELYKELVSTAKKLSVEEPENKEFYDEIIKRFQIVDYTSMTMEKLENIDAYLDENFTFRNSIVKSIVLLQEYRNKFPNNNIQLDIKCGRLAPEYLNAYKHLIAMDKYLTLANIEAIIALDIDFNGEILLDIDKRREMLNGHENMHELETAIFNKFRQDYIDFVNLNNRRPELGNDKNEDDLYSKYREYLGSMSKKKLMALFNKFNFKLTVEEIVLTGNYPNKDDLYAYFDKLIKKLAEGVALDKVELKVLKKLKSVIPIEYNQLKNYLDHKKDIKTMIDDAIKTIECSNINAKNLENKISFMFNSNISRAMKTIDKYAAYVTNEQFKRLLVLGIKLPRVLNMTLEERLEKLGEYDSFYEKEKYIESNVVANYFRFIESNGRRPSISNLEEEQIAREYDDYLLYTNVNKIKVLCASLDHYKIEHSFIEKVLLGEVLDEEEINIYVSGLIKKSKQQDVLDKKDLKILRALIQHQRFSYRQEAMDMLNVQTIYSKIYSMIAEYEFFNDSVNYNRLVYFIKSNNEYVTKELINKLKDIGIVFSDSFKNMVDNLDEFSSLKEKKLFEKRKIQSALEIYLRDYKRRPERGSELDLIYRKKIAGLLKNELRDYLKIFVRCGIPYTTEEKIILDLANPSEVKLYLDHLNVKIASEKYKVDNLEKRVLNKLKKRKMLNEYPRLLDLLPNYHNEITVEDKIVDELNQKIRRHPEENIDFEAYSLSVSPNKLWKLEARRMNMLINNYLIKILDKLKNKKISLRYLLSDEERELFESYREFNDLDKANVELFRNIKELEEEMRCEEENVYRDEILQNYLDFIHNHNGERPNCASDNEEEKSLANHFEIIRELLSRSEEAKITAAIKESEMGSYSSFYESYVNFILENERMPCGNSDDAYEVKLNNLYIDLNRKFSHEQNNEIRKLRKTFSRATMQATIEFNKKKG
ncbi:MAG: DEAD/DEAH box helicase family protein [Bacilli bacterium]|nr:DEAD/DEAH box helicase family protein [Bacilli bacterium]